MKSNSQFFSTVMVVRDKYTSDIHRAENIREARRKKMNENLKLNSPAYTEEREALQRDYETAIDKAKTEALKAVEDCYIRCEAEEIAKIRSISGAADSLRLLQTVAGLPVSMTEYRQLVDIFGGKNFWVDKALKSLATDNGIDTSGMLEPDFSDKMKVLSDLKNRIDDFIKFGNVDDLNMGLSDPALRLAEEKYTGGYVNFDFSPKRKALALLDEAKKINNPVVIGDKIANILESCDIRVGLEILQEVEQNTAYWGNIRTLSNLSQGINAFRAREKEEYKELSNMVATDELIAEVRRMSSAERTIALHNSQANKITRRGIDYLRSEQGQVELADLIGINEEYREKWEKEAAEIKAAYEMKQEQKHIEEVLSEG